MRIDGRGLGEDGCENAKEVLDDFGIAVVCDDEEAKPKADFVMPAGEDCENVKEVVSKIGKTVVCVDED